MVAGMIRRRWMRWGAVGAVAAVALTGCVGEEGPAPSTSTEPEPSLAGDALLSAGQAAYDGFLDELAAMYTEFDYDYTRLTPFASDRLATESVADMQATHEDGINLESTSTVAAAVLVESSDNEMDVCVDARGSRAYDIETGAEWEATGSQITAWRLELDATGSVVRIASRTPLYEESTICDSVQ